jgi:myo-inositol-1(or 4)-monophosphatase
MLKVPLKAMPDLGELLEIAREAASLAAAVHRGARAGSLDIKTKASPVDLVTAIDSEAERQLVAAIRRARPDDAILGEEGTDLRGSSGVRWILDPLDGTTNFIYGYAAHAVAVGVEIDGQRRVGVVHDTYHERVYTGIVGVGARCENRPIAVRAETVLARALIGTGFSPSLEVRETQGQVLRHLLPLVRDVRRSGCPALDLCAVASGTLDGFYESGLGRWDIAAGAAIAEAAGATVIELQSPLFPTPVLVAANAQLLKTLTATLLEIGAITMTKGDEINNEAAQTESKEDGIGDVETAGETTAAVAISGPPDTSPVGAETMVKVADAREPTVSGEND